MFGAAVVPAGKGSVLNGSCPGLIGNKVGRTGDQGSWFGVCTGMLGTVGPGIGGVRWTPPGTVLAPWGASGAVGFAIGSGGNEGGVAWLWPTTTATDSAIHNVAQAQIVEDTTFLAWRALCIGMPWPPVKTLSPSFGVFACTLNPGRPLKSKPGHFRQGQL